MHHERACRHLLHDASAAASGQLSAELTPAAVFAEAEQLARKLVRKQELDDKEYSASDLAALLRGHKNKAGHAKYWDKLAVDLVIHIRLQPSAWLSRAASSTQMSIVRTRAYACISAVARLSSIRHDHTAIRLIIRHIRLHTVHTHTAV